MSTATTPARFRNRHGDPRTWDANDFDAYHNLQATSRESHLAYRTRRTLYPAYQGLLAVHHLAATSPAAFIVGVAVTVFLWIGAPLELAAGFTPIGAFAALAWLIPGRKDDCPVCRRNLAQHRLTTAA